ncbi:hypothetical protein BSKO_13743 [Bryopsis sp. KO-2023]|nr:hypothetical protein BSKO_13743 [Bryopsis sp. KO-2023]
MESAGKRPVCFLTGVGGGTGLSLAKRFAEGGYVVAMIARDEDRLQEYEKDVPNTKGYVCDVADLEGLTATLKRVEEELGPIEVLIHNAVRATFSLPMEAEPKDLEDNFRVSVTALLTMARAVGPGMIERGHGVILATGNTASYRGVPTYSAFAPAKAGQRILCQSLARDMGPKGVHVAYVVIDAAIDAPWLGDKSKRPSWLVPPEHWTGKEDDYFCHPYAIADECYHTAHQDKSAWAFDVCIRPFGEKW